MSSKPECHLVRVTSDSLLSGWQIECDMLDPALLAELREPIRWKKPDQLGAELRRFQHRHNLSGLAVVKAARRGDLVDPPPPFDLPFEPLELKRERERVDAIVSALDVPTEEAPALHAPRAGRRRRQHRLHAVLTVSACLFALVAAPFMLEDLREALTHDTGFTGRRAVWFGFVPLMGLAALVVLLSDNRWMLAPDGVTHHWHRILKRFSGVRHYRPQTCALLATFSSSPPRWDVTFTADEDLERIKSWWHTEGQTDISSLTDAELRLLLAVWQNVALAEPLSDAERK